MPFRRLLVANRGEIAIRICRAATELNIRTVAIYSHEDRFALHRYKADEAYRIGAPGEPLRAYLDWRAIVDKARELGADAIHPGYGFLSENPDFARACQEAGITFVGPSPEVLALFGDKVAAKKAAARAGLPIIPGRLDPVPTLEEAQAVAQEIGFPVTLKALSGGGGKGIRIVHSLAELAQAFERARSEAATSFGRPDVYIEKTLLRPKHIEVQILGDQEGNIVHLFERDCSIQRRHQKVVEIAPALGIPESTRTHLHDAAIKLASSVQYHGVGTVEFLVDEQGRSYFLEVNPRIQVEHTVTEMVTGHDIVQASILVAAGKPLSHPALGIRSQDSIQPRGVAIQCRITTEDPLKDFAPDTGRITAYRPPQGFGVRLDEGHGTSGGIVTPYYDSLLVKVTVWALDLYGASRKMARSLTEFRIRGVRHNIPLLRNIVNHPKFYDGTFTTQFFAEHPEVFAFRSPRDRASKMLHFIADATVNNPHVLPDKVRRGALHSPALDSTPYVQPSQTTAKDVLRQGGVQALTDWIRNHKALLLTDTSMRDAHQSLFATRLRTRDVLNACDFYRTALPQFFSLEMWGGATFDTCLRFLKEDPWERLAQVRARVPNTLLQMLLRGDNAVGYTNYPEWVVRDFIRLTVDAGLDVFRIFDCLNNPEQMAVAIDEVRKRGAIAEACICYTGNVASSRETKYTLQYYIDIAKTLASLGADILCIKDMAGLLRPAGARLLIRALRDHVDLPIHLHTHDTSGNGVATLLAAAEAGCHIIDGAVSSMSGLTSQPSLNALIASLDGHDRCPTVPLAALDHVATYWEVVRTMYQAFDPGINATSTRVYSHEIPGGQYSNLYDQARKVGVTADEFYALTERFREVNDLFGNIVKVTPSSKVVGDMALLLQKHGLNGQTYLATKPKLDYPDSVVSFFRGHMGVPYGGFPAEVRSLVLGPDAPPPEKLAMTVQDSLSSVRADLERLVGRAVTDQEVLSYRLYPKVFREYLEHRDRFGDVTTLPTTIFFYGVTVGEEVEVDIEPGKTLIFTLRSVSDADAQGTRTVFFELNGYPREIRVQDSSLAKKVARRPAAERTNPRHVPSPMPGKVLAIKVALGDSVKEGQVLCVTESMKMEYQITAKSPGTVQALHIRVGEMIEDGDLLCEIG